MKAIPYMILALFLASCAQQQPEQQEIHQPLHVKEHDPLLKQQNGMYLYKEQPFTGTISSFHANGKLKRRQAFLQGREDGWTESWYPSGLQEEKRFFSKGEKEGQHRGWWMNGKLRFEKNFARGQYHGFSREWYESGRPLTCLYYWHSRECFGKGWRENGKPYMNFVVKDGVRYGIVNAVFCYSVKSE